MVRVSCMTYNHAPYIEDAMNGFCMQETSFPFVCTIVDDASTDGEQEVIKNYLQDHFNLEDDTVVRNEETADYYLTFAQHKTNRNCFFAVVYLKYNHYSITKSKAPYLTEWSKHAKYIAFCEGDDYWLDPNKLKNQVNLMEITNAGLCYSKFITDNGNTVHGYPYRGIEQLIVKNRIATLTVMVRTIIYNKYYEDINPKLHGWKMGDYPCWLWMEINSKVVFLDSVVAVYRVLEESVSHSKNMSKRLSFIESSREVRLFFARKYNLDKKIIDEIEDSYWSEKSSLFKRRNKQLYRECLKNIKTKSIKDRVNYILSYMIA